MMYMFYNGAYVAEGENCISNTSRAFNYGDGFFETVKILNSKLVNFSSHFERIKLSLSILKMKNDYTLEFFNEKVLQLLKLNKVSHGSIKIHISRGGAGRYLPETIYTDLLITSVSGEVYKNNKPISLCFYDTQYKSIGSLSNIKSANSLVSVLALVHAKENNFDNAILLNSSGNIAEVANANLFIVKNKKIYTPPLLEGCVDGTMRKWVFNQVVVFEKVILKHDVLSADEVFITNAINGFTPIDNVEGKYYKSFKIATFFQQNLINSCSDF